MSTPPTPQAPQTGPEAGEPTEPQSGGTPGPETPTPGTGETETGDERDENALPAWARAELESTRREAAKYRTRSKEIKTALEAAKTPEEFDQVAARVAELETELHRERLGRTYNLPAVFADLVQGDTDEARDEHAKALAAAYHQRSTGLGSGGLTPDAPTTPTDPAALAALISRGRR
ncbi:hypothetical protein OG196_15140 [Kitasatospora purpeofusca]|uniref:hypothetical protein n=1 Tax=Kitasatospora purpeofusca TaxID=67352 RepID=UPI002E0FC901|nr:hypothetical protein OG196_15140 [Kitasatospora purpeofusca]